MVHFYYEAMNETFIANYEAMNVSFNSLTSDKKEVIIAIICVWMSL